MSPVSRGRKTKKGRKPARPSRNFDAEPVRYSHPSALIDALNPVRQQPSWFDESVAAVLDGVGVLMEAQGPRELDDAAARLLGAEQHHRLNTQTSGFWFDWWFEHLADAAADRAREEATDPQAWQPYHRLLQAMTGLGTPALAQTAHTRLAQATKAVPRDQARTAPRWPRAQSKITATGQVWQMCDAYGARIAVIAGFTYPNGVDPSVYLLDIDTCGLVALAGAGTYDNVGEAAASWRAAVGPTAETARPVPVGDPGALHAVVHWDHGDNLLGDESRTVMDNWFRARRRQHELAEVLRKRRTPLPNWRNLHHDVVIGPTVTAFTDWYVERHGVAPDPEATEALAYEWLEGSLPGTERVVAPARIRYILGLMSDWIPDDPVTVAARTLLPDWIRWNAEQDHLPADLLNRTLSDLPDIIAASDDRDRAV
jgi:hypothetical protein